MTIEPLPTAPIDLRPIDLLDPAQDTEAEAWIAVHHAARRHAVGEDWSDRTLSEVRGLHRAGQKRRAVLGAWVEGRLVGALEVAMPLLDNPRLATVWLSVDPSSRRRGVGTALCVEAERIAREHGRSVLLTQTVWRPDGDDEAEDFARGQGFSIGMTELRSTVDLGDPARLRDLVRRETDREDDDYVLESFVDDMPEAWLEDRAVLKQRMLTDMPLGGLLLEKEQWDAERLRSELVRAREDGRRIVETVARHRPTGTLVGFTQVSVAPGQPTSGQQEDTLVLSEHRGHGLGLRLKAANALLLHEALPEVTTIRTWNADDNAPMLAVNRALGYVVDGHARQWQKILR